MSFFGDIYAGKAQARAAEFNAKVEERNAELKRLEAKQIMTAHNAYTLPKFDKTVEEIQGATRVAYLASGAEISGTPVEALYANELELQTDRDIMDYNAQNAVDRANNEAIMMRANADLERFRGKVAKKASYYAAGQSLLNTAGMFMG
jgi:hypothetical protein